MFHKSLYNFFFRSEQDFDDNDDDDAPVQGPLPYEPVDAPWRRSESGIRKLFVLTYIFFCKFLHFDCTRKCLTIFIFARFMMIVVLLRKNGLIIIKTI